MRLSSLRHCVPLQVALVLLSSAVWAQTNTPTINCYDAQQRPNVIYVLGASSARPFLGVVAKLLAQETPTYTIIYQSQSSCVGVNTIFSTDPNQRLMKDVPAAGGKAANYAIALSPDGVSAQECFLDPAGNTVDVGVSDIFAATCGATAPANVNIADYEGPIQPMTFVVPAASTQRSISAEAAYMVFGRGGNTGGTTVATPIPWTEQAFYFVRNTNSGTQQMLSGAIGVTADKWWGVDRGSSGGVRNNMKLLVDSATAEKAIGILSVDIADDERANLRVLAFQARGQTCGYLPDSTPFAFDKLNVRDGHYLVWGPFHFFARVNNGLPSAAAGVLVSRFAAPKLDQALVEALSKRHLVPKCAMKVKRTVEMGPLSVYTTDSRCDCFFALSATGAAPASCKTCAGSGDCSGATPACNYGFCEAAQ